MIDDFNQQGLTLMKSELLQKLINLYPDFKNNLYPELENKWLVTGNNIHVNNKMYYRMGKFKNKRFRLVPGCTKANVFDGGLPYLTDNSRPTNSMNDIYCMGYVYENSNMKEEFTGCCIGLSTIETLFSGIRMKIGDYISSERENNFLGLQLYEGRACLMFSEVVMYQSNVQSGGDCIHNNQCVVGTNCHILDINGQSVSKCFSNCENAVKNVSNASMDKCEIMDLDNNTITIRNKQDSIILKSSFDVSEEMKKDIYWMIDFNGTIIVQSGNKSDTFHYCNNNGNGIYSSKPCHFGYSNLINMRKNQTFSERIYDSNSYSTSISTEEELKENCNNLGEECQAAIYIKPTKEGDPGVGLYYKNNIDFMETTNDEEAPFSIYKNLNNAQLTPQDFLVKRHEITVLNGKLFHRLNNRCILNPLKVSCSDNVNTITKSFEITTSESLMEQYTDRIHIYDGELDLRYDSDNGQPPRGSNEWISRTDRSGPGIAYKNITTSSNYILEFDIWPENSRLGWNSVMHFTTGGNCCNYGSRLPAIWFWNENTTRLHIRTGTKYDPAQGMYGYGNNGGRTSGGVGIDKESTYNLPVRHWTRVRVVVEGNYFRVYYDKKTDNRIALGNKFENVCTQWIGPESWRPPVSNVTAHVPGPWSTANSHADVKLKRIIYYRLNTCNDNEDFTRTLETPVIKHFNLDPLKKLKTSLPSMD